MASPSFLSPVPEVIEFKNILFATDFSPCSTAALPFARAIAEHYGSTVHLVNVIGSESLVGPLGVPIQDIELDRETAQNRMDTFEHCDDLKHVMHTVTLERGVVWDVISKLISDLHIDLIVLGTHGRHGVKHFVLGSVAEQVFRRATCPVLTVGPEVRHDGMAEGQLSSLLYATDFSPGSHHAFDHALSLALAYNAKLTLVHAIDSDVLSSFGEQAVSIVKARLEQLMPRDAGVNYSVVAECGSATDMILKAARKAGANLIVMGSRKGPAGSAHAPWATAHRIICYAACPVLTVHE